MTSVAIAVIKARALTDPAWRLSLTHPTGCWLPCRSSLSSEYYFCGACVFCCGDLSRVILAVGVALVAGSMCKGIGGGTVGLFKELGDMLSPLVLGLIARARGVRVGFGMSGVLGFALLAYVAV